MTLLNMYQYHVKRFAVTKHSVCETPYSDYGHLGRSKNQSQGHMTSTENA